MSAPVNCFINSHVSKAVLLSFLQSVGHADGLKSLTCFNLKVDLEMAK